MLRESGFILIRLFEEVLLPVALLLIYGGNVFDLWFFLILLFLISFLLLLLIQILPEHLNELGLLNVVLFQTFISFLQIESHLGHRLDIVRRMLLNSALRV